MNRKSSIARSSQTFAKNGGENTYTLVSTIDGAEGCEVAAENERQQREWAAAKALRIYKRRATGFVNIEPKSVYGAALALPQLARSAGWTSSYTALATRGMAFMIANSLLQAFLLYMISKAERVIDKFGGQMYLCDFGASLVQCPGNPNCLGPEGTEYTAERLYNWKLWVSRTFVRDSLKALFPDKIDEINEQVDPGEYGLESYHLRAICCFLFVLGLWSDLVDTWEMLDLVTNVPSVEESWISPSSDLKFDAVHDEQATDVEFVQMHIAGMSFKWKVINIVFLIFPKMYLWILTVDIGIVFLMETSVIEDMIINCVALGFILSIDELMIHVLPPEGRDILASIESAPKKSTNKYASDEEEFLAAQAQKNWSCLSPFMWAQLVPRRLAAMLATTVFFVWKYYVEHCFIAPDGSFISEPLYLPIDMGMSILSFLAGPIPHLLPLQSVAEPLWTFPESQLPPLNSTGTIFEQMICAEYVQTYLKFLVPRCSRHEMMS